MRRVISRVLYWVADKLLAPQCEVCGDQATGRGPLGRNLCYSHAKEAWEVAGYDV